MANVTIVGSRTPCAELAKGVTRTVQHTDHVQRLIDRGFVEIVEWHDDDEVAGLTADKSGERAAGTGMPPPVTATGQGSLAATAVVQEADGGADSADRGESDAERMATEGSAEGSAVDEAGEAAPKAGTHRRPRQSPDPAEQ